MPHHCIVHLKLQSYYTLTIPQKKKKRLHLPKGNFIGTETKCYCLPRKKGMRTAGSKFDISEANVHCWRND